VDGLSEKRWADEASGRCKIEASEVASVTWSVMTRALTTSGVAELNSLVQAGVGKGELGKTPGDPSSFVSCATLLGHYLT
jgi:hypothetical protein